MTKSHTHTHHMQVVDLRQNMAALHQKMADLINAAEKENRSLNDSERNEYNGMEGEYRSIKQRVADLEALDKRNQDIANFEQTMQREMKDMELNVATFMTLSQEQQQRAKAEATKLMNAYVRSLAFEPHLAQQALRAAMTSTTQGVPNLINTIFSNTLIETARETGNFLAEVEVIRTSTAAAYDIDTRDTASKTGFWTTENTLVSQTDWTYANVTLAAYKFSTGYVTFTHESMRDTYRDMYAEMMKVFTSIYNNSFNAAVTTGDGVGKPTGFMATGQITNTLTGAVGQTTRPTYAALKDLIHKVDLPYRKGAKFIMNDATVKEIYNIVDGQSRPIFTEGIRYAENPTLLGYDIIVNQDMPLPAANAKSIAFFNPKFYKFRIVDEPMRIETSKEILYDRTNYVSYAAVDGKLLLPQATAATVYVHSAT